MKLTSTDIRAYWSARIALLKLARIDRQTAIIHVRALDRFAALNGINVNAGR